MAPHTPSVYSGDSSYSWESLLDKSHVYATHTRTQHNTIKEHDNECEFSIDENCTLEEFKLDNGQKDKSGDHAISCSIRSALSSFSIYLRMDESARVSVLGEGSFDEQSLDTKGTAKTHCDSFSSIEIDTNDFSESEMDTSVVSEVDEIYADGESEYEVKSMLSSEALEATDLDAIHGDCRSISAEQSVDKTVYELDQDDESEFEVSSMVSEAIEPTDNVVVDSEYGPLSAEPSEENSVTSSVSEIISVTVSEDSIEGDDCSELREHTNLLTNRHRRKEKRWCKLGSYLRKLFKQERRDNKTKKN